MSWEHRLRRSRRRRSVLGAWVRSPDEVVVEPGIENAGPCAIECALDEAEHEATDAKPLESGQKRFQQPPRVKRGWRNQPVADAQHEADCGEARETLRDNLPVQHGY